MGRSETVTSSIGIRIALKDLINSINEDNYKQIKKEFLTYESLIDDDNDSYNSIYSLIIHGDISDDYKCDQNYKEYKEYLETNCRKYGNINIYKNGEEKKCTYDKDDENNLYNQCVLIPQQKLLSTERYGYDRNGTNGSSVKVEKFNLNDIYKNINDKMTSLNIKNYAIVFIVSQHSS